MGIREMKRLARGELRGNYLRCVVAGMIYIAATSGVTTGIVHTPHENYRTLLEELLKQDPAFFRTAWGMTLAYFSWKRILAYLLVIFLWNPLEIGARRFFIDDTLTGHTKLLDIPYSLRENYLRKVSVMLARAFIVRLWLLLIVPGIIKAYSYRLVPLLLAEYPDLPAREIFRRSEEMMRGNRLRLFRLEMSFIGWNLLSSVMGGLPHVLYAAPMLNICYARFYNELIEKQAAAAEATA